MPSQLSFDPPRVYDPILNVDSLTFTDVWISYWTDFIETLISYLSEFGIFLPQLTGDERDSINEPLNGQLIYNLTVDAPQFWQSSSNSWRTITFT